jgi:hypothetical protein
MSPSDFLAEMQAAHEQGERVISSLWPGDSFYFRGDFHLIKSMQLGDDQRSIIVRTGTPVGEPYLIPTHRLVGPPDNRERIPYEGEQRLHQPHLTFLFDGHLLFPAILSDEHFAQENPEVPEVW